MKQLVAAEGPIHKQRTVAMEIRPSFVVTQGPKKSQTKRIRECISVMMVVVMMM